jgi:hypothetical protein
VAFCSKCGSAVPAGATFCPSCGTPVMPSAQPVWQNAPETGLSSLGTSVAARNYWVRRLIAYLIDAIIIYAILGIVAAAAYLPAYFASLFIPGFSPRVVLLGGFFSLFANMVFILCCRRVELREDDREERHGPQGRRGLGA